MLANLSCFNLQEKPATAFKEGRSNSGRRKLMSRCTRKAFVTAILLSIFVTALLAGYLRQVHAAPGQNDEQVTRTSALTTTDKDQVDLAVTVYNSNLALV